MNSKWLRRGLVAAGAMNIGGVLVFSRGFTNDAIHQADAVVMSNFGLLMITVWGLAYIAAAAIASGMTDGMEETYGKLETVLSV